MPSLTSVQLWDLVDCANEAIFVIDPTTGRIAYANQQACNQLGYTRAELYRLTVPDIDPTFAKPWPDERVRGLGTKPTSFPATLQDRTGTVVPVTVQASYILGTEGPYIVAFVQALPEGGDCKLIEQLPLLFAVCLPDTTLIYINSACATHLGTTKEAMRGQSWLKWLPEGEHPEVQEVLTTLTLGHRPWSRRSLSGPRRGFDGSDGPTVASSTLRGVCTTLSTSVRTSLPSRPPRPNRPDCGASSGIRPITTP